MNPLIQSLDVMRSG